jgi:hypothetical protein
MPTAKITNTTPYTTYTMTVQAKNAIGLGPKSPPIEAQFNYNKATGGQTPDGVVEENYNGTNEQWTVHTLLPGDTFNVESAIHPFKVLVIGGGGGGGGDQGGGGGAGGAHETELELPSGNITAVIGAGGTAGQGQANGTKGGNTTFHGITSYGGGWGGGYDGRGGSGGAGGSGEFQGKNGGGHSGGAYGSGGGGGGHNRKSSITGTELTYSQGGGGYQSGTGHGAGTPANYGSGGGGGGAQPTARGSNGRSGAIIVAYRTG